MGSVPSEDDEDRLIAGLFGELPKTPARRKDPFHLAGLPRGFSGRISPPRQSVAKAELVAHYIRLFLRVAQGGVYIDGFSGPQKDDFEEVWTAKRVLETAGPRLHTAYLGEMDLASVGRLRELKSAHHNPPLRRVWVFEGDFNKEVRRVVESRRIKKNTAAFAFLDQRMMECSWETVQALSQLKSHRKVELLYFAPTGWIHRGIRERSSNSKIAEAADWWGGDDWRDLADLTVDQIARRIAGRFESELGYEYVTAMPIYLYGAKKAFYLIHASDHPEAPKLMSRAYRAVEGDRLNTPGSSQRSMDFSP